MDRNRRQKRRWITEIVLVCLIPILLIGLLLGQVASRSAQDAALSRAREEARLITEAAFATPLASQNDLSHGLSGDQEAMLDAQVATVRAGEGLSRVLLRARDGHIVYADDHSLLAQQLPESPGSRDAVNGDIASAVVSEPGAGTVLQVFVPLRLGDRPPLGSAELWLPYAPIAAQMASESHTMQAILAIGLLVLWFTLIGVIYAASERIRRRAAEKEELALSDPLTGLANRAMFHHLLEKVISGSGRRTRRAAVMLMDLDRFKDVNDTLGHHNGDLLLQRIGARLASVLGDSAPVARLGGDEFAILVRDVSDRQAVVPFARRVLKLLEEPIVVGGLALQVEASIGIALFPEHGRTPEAVMRAADVAMYVTKESRSGFEFYSEQHEQRHDAGRLALIGELRRAMDETELVLYYQPKVDLRTGKAAGVEALARWRHPERGLLSPDEFIPLAERSNLLRPMTLYVLDTALRQCHAWRSKGREVTVAINLSMQNMLDLRLPNDLARLLTSWRLPGGSLELEITESTIMADQARATEILKRLSKMGVRLAIDDFGTGYSSLAYLQELPVDAIKIDKSFVITMREDKGNATIVQSTIDLGHNLGLQVIAEGVETAGIYNQLVALGCDYAQGYFLSKPLAPEKMSVWLEAYAERPIGAQVERERREEQTLERWALEAPAP